MNSKSSCLDYGITYGGIPRSQGTVSLQRRLGPKAQRLKGFARVHQGESFDNTFRLEHILSNANVDSLGTDVAESPSRVTTRAGSHSIARAYGKGEARHFLHRSLCLMGLAFCQSGRHSQSSSRRWHSKTSSADMMYPDLEFFRTCKASGKIHVVKTHSFLFMERTEKATRRNNAIIPGTRALTYHT